MRPTKTLPESYRRTGIIDLKKNRPLLLILNVIALVVMAASGLLFFQAIIRLRPGDAAQAMQTVKVSSLIQFGIVIGVILGLIILHVLIHEAIHGVFFWAFTHERPQFAFQLTYAYAAAPDWYLPRNLYFITAVAPLVFITLGGLALIPVLPLAWVLPVWFTITMNAGGSAGDLMVAGWLLMQPPECLANDAGDTVSLFVPSKKVL